MTVTYLGEVNRKGKNSLGVRTYTRTFKLKTSLRSEGVFDVGSHASLPRIGSGMPSDPDAYCTSLAVDNTDPWSGWTATAEFTTESKEQDESGDPADDKPKVSFSSEIYQEPAFKDADGKAILNSAGDFFVDPAPSRDMAHLIAQIAINVPAVPTWVLNYQNAINNAAITINGLSIDKGLAKVQRIGVGEQQVRGFHKFYPVSLEVHIHTDGWNLKPLDCGFRFRDENDNDKMKNIQVDGQDITQPAPLNGEGRVIEKPTLDNAKFRNFTIYKELDFSALPGID